MAEALHQDDARTIAYLGELLVELPDRVQRIEVVLDRISLRHFGQMEIDLYPEAQDGNE